MFRAMQSLPNQNSELVIHLRALSKPIQIPPSRPQSAPDFSISQ